MSIYQHIILPAVSFCIIMLFLLSPWQWGGHKSPKVASLDPTTVLWDTSQPCAAVQQWDAQRAAVITCRSTNASPSLFWGGYMSWSWQWQEN